MTLRNGRRPLFRARPLLKAKAFSVTILATLAAFGVAGALAPASAQVKAPQVKQAAKPKARPVVQSDPTDRMADQLNAKWQQDNAAFAGFTAATPAPATVQAVSYSVPASSAATGAKPAVATEWGDKLVSRAMNYLGTPYRYGGTSPQTGFDCSGFVYYLYGAVFGQRIPRMPHEMVRQGTPVARSDLQRGDLVLFGYRGTFTHIGIYAGNDQFVHATHRGSPVMVTNLDADYYRQRYITAVRLSPQ
ncbi:C40 family peptidase [Reyranella aquatilis]|uniref:C40 family peptidase n=1 Tax=Reyranella aquatilis TaxID=2035356 RepID=A0ABS8L1U7_9HYPH|nr:C40 family peptidase [Reyranella aquatilis]MCC8432322.1 C40 family peptidase [Reyranella aquatilis]